MHETKLTVMKDRILASPIYTDVENYKYFMKTWQSSLGDCGAWSHLEVSSCIYHQAQHPPVSCLYS